MAKVLFFNMPLHGHVNPTLPVVKELAERGEEVVYFLTEPYRSAVERAGARLHRYESTLEGLSKGPGGGSPPLPALMIGESRKLLPSLLEAVRAEAPEYVVYDPMCLWGRIISQVLKLPAAISCPSYATNEHWSLFHAFRSLPGGPPAALLERLNTELRALAREYQAPELDLKSLLSQAEPLNLVFLPRSFQPAGDTFDERFAFVGPSILPRGDHPDFPLSRLQGQPTLYISLGTVFNDWPDFYRTCFAAFSGPPWQVVLAAGNAVRPEALQGVPDNFLVRPSVPQLEVLERSSVFITHGGMNSTMEALYHGVPLVVIPQMPEQALTGARVAELGLGVVLERTSVTASSLGQAVERVAKEPSFRERARSLQAEVQAAGGYRRAAEALLALRSRGRQGSPRTRPGGIIPSS